jgi:hypothetical protein
MWRRSKQAAPLCHHFTFSDSPFYFLSPHISSLTTMTAPDQLMSGQSDAERRKIRHKQRDLLKRMHEHEDEMENAQNSTFEELRGENNDIWKRVKYTREAVLDGENLDVIAARAARQVDKLVQVSRNQK